MFQPCIDLIIVKHKVWSHPSPAKEDDDRDEHDDDHDHGDSGMVVVIGMIAMIKM